MNIRSQTEARNLSLDALNSISLSIECISGIEALLKAINLQVKEGSNQIDVINLSKLGSGVCSDYIIMLSDQKEQLKKAFIKVI